MHDKEVHPGLPAKIGVRLAELLTPQEASRFLKISVNTLAQWRTQRRGIPYYKIGHKVGYHPDDVRAYLEGCRVSVSVPRGRRLM